MLDAQPPVNNRFPQDLIVEFGGYLYGVHLPILTVLVHNFIWDLAACTSCLTVNHSPPDSFACLSTASVPASLEVRLITTHCFNVYPPIQEYICIVRRTSAEKSWILGFVKGMHYASHLRHPPITKACDTLTWRIDMERIRNNLCILVAGYHHTSFSAQT